MNKEKEPEKTIRLTMTEDEARIVAKACEFYARIAYGQFNEITYHFLDMNLPTDEFCKRRDELEDLLFRARAVLYPDLGRHVGTSYGYGRFKDADKAFDVYELLRIAYGDNRYPLLTNPYPDMEMKVGEEWKKIAFGPGGMRWE